MAIIAIFFLLIAITAVLFRCGLQLTGACLHVGRAISDGNSKTGFQDAITPPILTNVMLSVYVFSFALFIIAYFEAGVTLVISLAIEFVFISTVTAFFIPSVSSKHWVKLIYNSLANRCADYAKKNDRERSNAAKLLAQKVASQFAAAFLE